MPELSKKEQALLIKALWESLQCRTWVKDELIAFGRAIFSKKSLSELAGGNSEEKKLYETVAPFMFQISGALASKLFTITAQPVTETKAAGQAPAPSGEDV